jgi:hypothetical protein
MSLFQAKRRYRSSILALGAAALTAIPLFAAVSTDYDHNANFRAYYTFSFYKVQSTDPFFDQRIKDEVTKDLTKAGYQMVPSGGADGVDGAAAGVRPRPRSPRFRSARSFWTCMTPAPINSYGAARARTTP